MIRTLLIIGLLLTGFVGLSTAQKPDEHRPTSFTDSLGRFIVNVNMPLYLYVATSPDEAPQRLERSDRPENDPILLDGPGKHYIRHQDNINHRADMFPIWADAQAPRTTIALRGAQTFVRGGVTWYGENLSITLTANDDLSGVKQIYYSFDGDDFKPYNAPIEVKEEGKFKFSYYAVDNVGNVETVQVREFYVDLTPPQSQINVEGLFNNDILSSDVRISLTSEDSLSGLNRIFYRFNDEPAKVYRPGTNIPFAHLPNGLNILFFFAEDRVNNREEEKSFNFLLDKLAPIISADVLGDKFMVGDRVYFSGRTKLKLTAVDNISGIKEVKYSINNAEFVEYVDPFYLPATTGRHVVRYYATDNMGNTSRGDYTHNMGIVWVDLIGPILSYEISGPSFSQGGKQYISPESKIILKGIDNESGFQYISFSTDNDEGETRYEGPFSIAEHGTHVIRFVGFDNVNNSNTSQFEVTVDSEGPEIFATFSTTPAASENADNVDVYPSFVLLYLAATDANTGISEIRYSINDARELLYTAPIRGFTKNTSYSIVVTAKDMLGNLSEQTLRFRINDI